MSGVRLSRQTLNRMLARGWGRIIFVGSESGVNVPADMVHYGVTKAAMLALGNGLAKLTRGTDVTVDTILGGPTYSDGVARAVDQISQAQGVTAGELKVATTHPARSADVEADQHADSLGREPLDADPFGDRLDDSDRPGHGSVLGGDREPDLGELIARDQARLCGVHRAVRLAAAAVTSLQRDAGACGADAWPCPIVVLVVNPNSPPAIGTSQTGVDTARPSRRKVVNRTKFSFSRLMPASIGLGGPA